MTQQAFPATAITLSAPVDLHTPALQAPAYDIIQLNAQDRIDRFAAATKAFQVFAELGAYAPHPTRPAGHYDQLPEPYLGQYLDCNLPLVAEHRLRQAYELRMHVLSDSAGFAELTGIPDNPFESTRPNLDQLADRRRAMQTKLVLLKNVQKAQLAALHYQPVVNKVVFDSLHLSTPDSVCTTQISPECRDFMAMAEIDMPLNSSPLGLYQALGKSLVAREQVLIQTGLEILRDELHAVRMEFYDEMGEVLLAQAQAVMDEYALPVDAQLCADLLDTKDRVYTQLQQVLVDPLNTDWPAPSREDKEQPSGFGRMD